jgi:hypothetical protein
MSFRQLSVRTAVRPMTLCESDLRVLSTTCRGRVGGRDGCAHAEQIPV